MESWKGEGGDAADAGAVVGSCPRKSEGEAEGGGGEAAQREPIRDRLSACLVATLRCREKKAHARGPGSRTPMRWVARRRMRSGWATATQRMGGEKISVKNIVGMKK